MSSSAYNRHLEDLLEDAELLLKARRILWAAGQRGSQPALNRAIVVLCVSAWEAYIEELVREALTALRPAGPPLGSWPALNAAVRGQLGRFNTPSVENVRQLLSDSLGLPNVHLAWAWEEVTSEQAVARLTEAMAYRHRVAHGFHPRPVVMTEYAADLIEYFRELGRRTDDIVRGHLVNALGLAEPWPG